MAAARSVSSVSAQVAMPQIRFSENFSRDVMEALVKATEPRPAPSGQHVYTVDYLIEFFREIERIMPLGLTDKELAKTELLKLYNNEKLEERPPNDILAHLLRAKYHRAMTFLVEDSQKEEFIINAYKVLCCAHDNMPPAIKQSMLVEIVWEFSSLLEVAKSVDPKLEKFHYIKSTGMSYAQEAGLSLGSVKKTDAYAWGRIALFAALGLVAVVASVKFAMYCLQSRNKAL